MNQPPDASTVCRRMTERLRRLSRRAAEVADDLQTRAYLVGGVVRDLLTEAPGAADLDISVEGDYEAFAREFAGRTEAAVRAVSRFMTVRIDLPDGAHLDVAATRQEAYPHPANLPVVEPAGIEDDLRRRDFSINAIALRLSASEPFKLVDPCDGSGDLRRGAIRILHDGSFIDDPTRIIRAARFAARLGFSMDERTAAALRRAVADGWLARVSGTRVRDEVAKLFREPAPGRVLQWLAGVDALSQAIPGASAAPQSLHRLRETPRALAALGTSGQPAAWPYMLGAVCTGGDAAATADRLVLSRLARGIVLEMCEAPDPQTAGILNRRRPLGDDALDDLLAGTSDACRVRLWLAGGAAARRRIERYAHAVGTTSADIAGGDLANAGIAPGPAMSVGLAAARRAKLGETASASRQLEAALEAIRRWKAPGPDRTR